jgi:hypothetical protein
MIKVRRTRKLSGLQLVLQHGAHRGTYALQRDGKTLVGGKCYSKRAAAHKSRTQNIPLVGIWAESAA